MKFFLTIFLVFLFISTALLVFPKLALAEDSGDGGGGCVPCSQTYYRCTKSCDGVIMFVSSEPCCSGFYREWPVATCQPWQQCQASRFRYSCACSGACLETPENPKYYDNPAYSNRPDKSLDSNSIRLPIKFDWDDVTGWLAEPDGPQSYIFNLENSPKDNLAKILNISEYGDLRQEKGACFLKSNSAYNWQVQACCAADGQNCGQASSWNFTTSPAPELISPYDPDWAGEKNEQNVSAPATLDWCDVEEANSYALKAYVVQGGQKICHPNLLAVKEGNEFCDPQILRKKRESAEQIEKTLFSGFLDPGLYFFTGDSSYFWEIATCVDDSGLECGDYSQQWGFNTGKKELPGAFLVNPPNDPSGQKPTGLPLVLSWRKDEGINSWRYKINSIEEFTNTSQSRSFDYPELSLNTFYQWQALSCLDYRGEKCESPWSEIYHFKTTGQPPLLIYPEQGSADIVIPVNFDWEDVPGAKSYVFKIQGDGLDLEKPADKSEFSLDYPDLKMLVNYSWQVKTCAREEGKVCGDYSAPHNFQTFILPKPQGPSPADNGPLSTDAKFVSWKNVAGAKAYQYQIKYLSSSEKETDATCQSLAGKEVSGGQKTILTNSDFAEMNCLGEYQWQARACLDEGCEAAGEWANWTFTLVEPSELSGVKGLIPCGLSYNNPDTPWNERESCEIKHLFLLMKVVIDFLLFRVVPVILVILTIVSGLMLYSPSGKAAALAGVISLWKSAIIGLFIIFLAWTMVNLFLQLIGYQVGIFGNWYQF